jgi:hypothetical protein
MNKYDPISKASGGQTSEIVTPPAWTTCDLCGELIINAKRDAISGELHLDPLIIGGEATRHAHLGCYRLNRELLARGLDPRDFR